MTEITTTAVLGAGVIGASWTALFAAAGMDVRVYDVSPSAEADVTEYVEKAWPTLLDLGLAQAGRKGNISFHASAAEAVTSAQFVQVAPSSSDLKTDADGSTQGTVAMMVSPTIPNLKTGWSKTCSKSPVNEPLKMPPLSRWKMSALALTSNVSSKNKMSLT